MQQSRSNQVVKFCVIFILSLVVACGPGRYLFSFAYHTGDQSYILLVPILCAMLVYRDQQLIFSQLSPGLSKSSAVAFGIGLAMIVTAYFLAAGTEVQLVFTAVGLVACWSGAFMFCFGTKSARAALFPLLMLLWMVPIPEFAIAAITRFLQVGSAETVAALFRATGTPVLREGGFIFNLPGQSIEVAKECSGIRSSLCLTLLTIVIAHESLRGNIRRTLLLAATIPIVILKNGVRIVTLTLLAIHVDPSFLTGSLHHDGGIVFFLLGLVMLMPLLALLRRGDKPVQTSGPTLQEAAAGTS